MPAIPPFVLKKLYVEGSLRAEDGGFAFELKNLVAPATITAFNNLDVDGDGLDPARVTLVLPTGKSRSMDEVSAQAPLHFPVGATLTLRIADTAIEPGPHELTLRMVLKEVGPLDIPICDTLA